MFSKRPYTQTAHTLHNEKKPSASKKIKYNVKTTAEILVDGSLIICDSSPLEKENDIHIANAIANKLDKNAIASSHAYNVENDSLPRTYVRVNPEFAAAALDLFTKTVNELMGHHPEFNPVRSGQIIDSRKARTSMSLKFLENGDLVLTEDSDIRHATHVQTLIQRHLEQLRAQSAHISLSEKVDIGDVDQVQKLVEQHLEESACGIPANGNAYFVCNYIGMRPLNMTKDSSNAPLYQQFADQSGKYTITVKAKFAETMLDMLSLHFLNIDSHSTTNQAESRNVDADYRNRKVPAGQLYIQSSQSNLTTGHTQERQIRGFKHGCNI